VGLFFIVDYTEGMTVHTTPQFSVDTHGAYLTKLVDQTGGPILFERTDIDGKRRGGAHVSFPYFGADAAGKLPQHGFGRDVEWATIDVADDEIACSYMERDDNGLYQGLSVTILYKLYPGDNELYSGIVISNPFPRTGPQFVSPGFHPYFAVDPGDVKLNGKRVDLSDFEPYKEYPNTEAMTIESGGRTITVSSIDLQHMVVWTDGKGDYLCVEPTLSGHSFDSSQPSGVIIEPQSHTVQYGYTIKWS
jgi:glucose-6-phosphate 1-epimerase